VPSSPSSMQVSSRALIMPSDAPRPRRTMLRTSPAATRAFRRRPRREQRLDQFSELILDQPLLLALATARHDRDQQPKIRYRHCSVLRPGISHQPASRSRSESPAR
jgi:hypothetical protein